MYLKSLNASAESSITNSYITIKPIKSITIKQKFIYTNMLLNEYSNEIINVGSPFWMSIEDLIHIFEAGLNKKANYSTVNIGDEYIFDSKLSLEVAKKIGINFDNKYVINILKKYYSLMN